MAKIHAYLFIHAPDAGRRSLFERLFSAPHEADDWEEQFVASSAALNDKRGAELARAFLEAEEFETDYPVCIEHVEVREDVVIVKHVFEAAEAEEAMHRVVAFVHALCPDVLARAFGRDGDTSSEFWLRPDDGKVVRRDHRPQEDDDADREFLDTTFRWWCEGLPGFIKPGLLYQGLANHHVVITGKMEDGAREAMAESAREAGAQLQADITARTTLLVIGGKPGASKLAKAGKFSTRIATEPEFHAMAASGAAAPSRGARKHASPVTAKNRAFFDSPFTEGIRGVLERCGDDVNAICRAATGGTLAGLDLAQFFRPLLAASHQTLTYTNKALSLYLRTGKQAGFVIEAKDTHRTPLGIDYEGIVAHFAAMGLQPRHRVVRADSSDIESESWEWNWQGPGFVACVSLTRCETGFESPSIEMQFKLPAVDSGLPGAEIARRNLRSTDTLLALEWPQVHARCLEEAGNGSVEAMFALSQLYRRGRGCDASSEQSIAWLTKAADAGHPGAQCELGGYLHDGIRGVERDRERGLAYLRSAADADPEAQRKLQLIERQEEAVKRFNPDKAAAVAAIAKAIEKEAKIDSDELLLLFEEALEKSPRDSLGEPSLHGHFDFVLVKLGETQRVPAISALRAGDFAKVALRHYFDLVPEARPPGYKPYVVKGARTVGELAFDARRLEENGVAFFKGRMINADAWKTRDAGWMAQREREWLDIERKLAYRETGKTMLKRYEQYYLKGKIPKAHPWEDKPAICMFYLLWWHPDRSEENWREIRETIWYVGNDCLFMDQYPIFWTQHYEESLREFSEGAGSWGNMTPKEGFPGGFMDGLEERMFNFLVDIEATPCDATLYGASPAYWLNDDDKDSNPNVFQQYDKFIERWYACLSSGEHDRFLDSTVRKGIEMFLDAVARFPFDRRPPDHYKAVFARKIHDILDNRAISPAFRLLWQRAKAGELGVG